jgi:hypothetical protein
VNIFRSVFITISFWFSLDGELILGMCMWDVVLRGLRPDAKNVVAKIRMGCQCERLKERTR